MSTGHSEKPAGRQNGNIKLTSDLIYGFTGSVLSSNFDEPAPTPDCHREWWELCCSDHKRVAIAAPRGHAKSTAITKAYTLAAVLFRANDYVIIVSDTYRQAVMFLGAIKRELESNLDLRALFGVKGFLVDREDEIVVELDDGYQFNITALGSEQKIRGSLWNDRRPNLIVGDDMENDEMVMNPERREKFRVWFFNALLPTLSERGRIRLVGTILHLDSMLERLMPKDIDKTTRFTPLKNYIESPVNGWMTARYRAHDDDYSHMLWPIKWTKERLQEIQRMFISQGNPEGYYQEYLNRPIDPENAFFRREDFQSFEDTDYDRTWEYNPTYCSVDLAVSTKDRRDWSAFGVGSVDDSGMLYLRHVVRERFDPKEQIETIVRLQERYRFNVLLIGKGTLEKSLGPFLQDELRRRGKFLHIETIPESIDKRLRAQSIRGRMRAGGVKFNKKASWYPVFEEELRVFDRGTYNDQVDMMSLFGMYIDQIIDAPTLTEQQQIEWEDENQAALMEEWDFGRSFITGY